MSPREVTADHLRTIEKAIGIPCDRWTGLHATSIVAAAVNLADKLKPPVIKPDDNELSDEQAHDKFIGLCAWRARDAGIKTDYPHLDEEITKGVTKDHPQLAAQAQCWADGWKVRDRQSRR